MLIGKSRTSLTKAEQIELLKSYIEISGGQKRIIAILAEAGILVGKTWLSSAIHGRVALGSRFVRVVEYLEGVKLEKALVVVEGQK